MSAVPPIVRKVGKYERLWRERHARDLELAAQPGGHPKGFRFDAEAGERVVRFVEGYCRHHEGKWAGQPLVLEEWQRDVIRQVFGWLNADGTRRFRKVYIEIGRKNGKSLLIAGLALYMLIADGEQGAQVYSSATKKDQAKIVWDNAAAMVAQSPNLKRFVRVMRNGMFCQKTGSKFVPLSSEDKKMDGLNPHCNVVDELHAHETRKLWDVLDSAMGAREQPLTLAITTAGGFDPESIGWQMHDYATKVLEGVVEADEFFALICSAYEGEETDERLKNEPEFYFSPEAQLMANPNYGVSCKPSWLAAQAQQAKDMPGSLTEYLTKNCNVWVRGDVKWLSVAKWNASEAPLAAGTTPRAYALEREKALENQRCFAGLDLASKLDLNALVLAFPQMNDVIELICRFWLPEKPVREAAEKGQHHYEQWRDAGWLTVTPGDVIDYAFIKAEMRALAKRYSIAEVAFDRFGAREISTALTDDGFKMVECGQGYVSLSEPAKVLQARTVAGKIRHAHNPVLRFCVSNAVVTTDPAGNIKPDKSKATDKIDGVVAAVMALSRIIVAPPPPKNPYETRGFRQL